MPKKEETQVATTGTTAVAKFDPAAYAQYAGRGFEENDQSLMKLPIIKLCQSGTAIVKEPKGQRPAHLKDVDAGWLIDTVTEEVWDIVRPAGSSKREGVEIVPVHFSHCFTRWKPDMGGFVDKYPYLDPRCQQIKKTGEFGNLQYDGDDLFEDVELYSLIKSKSGAPLQVVFDLRSTALGSFKDWNGKSARFCLPNPDPQGKSFYFPLFAHRTLVYSTFMPKAGEKPSYFKIGFEPLNLDDSGKPSFYDSILPATDPRFTEAAIFQEQVVANAVVADHASTVSGAAASTGKADNTTDTGFKAKAAGGF